MIKQKIRHMSFIYCINTPRVRKGLQLFLQDRLSSLGISNEDQDNELSHVRRQLSEFYEYEIHGAQIRSKIKWYDDGERNNKHLLGLEKETLS